DGDDRLRGRLGLGPRVCVGRGWQREHDTAADLTRVVDAVDPPQFAGGDPVRGRDLVDVLTEANAVAREGLLGTAQLLRGSLEALELVLRNSDRRAVEVRARATADPVCVEFGEQIFVDLERLGDIFESCPA